MDLSDVYARKKRGCQILFTRQSDCLQLFRMQLCRCDRRAVVLWALTMARQTAGELAEKYPQHSDVQTAVEVCFAWASGKVKMPQAKPYILQVHAMAKTVSDPADAARFHAVGQACSAVHTETHAMGFAVYDCTALVCAAPQPAAERLLAPRLQQYADCLQRCVQAVAESGRAWAPFLCRAQENKEYLLWLKEQPAVPEGTS
ncbi:MAG: hypothetical protein KH282_08375 [Clostridiales bacterium]|nr:hypothetical protein [Clostridiales bacterium]